MNKIIILVFALFITVAYSCKEKGNSVKVSSSSAVQVDSLPGTCPYLTKDSKGNTVLSWVRRTNDYSSVLCYAVSRDGGKSFGSTIAVPSSTNIHPHSENLPKIIFKPSGEIVALWGVSNPNALNKYSGLINYAQSFDEGKSWSGAKSLVNDTASYDQRYSDVALLANGEIAIIWLDNRVKSVSDGSALYFASTNGRGGFQQEKMISEPCCECCRTDLFVDSKNNIHVLYRGIIQDSIRDMVHAVSADGGNSFSEPKQINDDHWVLNGCPHTGPAMAENKAGLHFAWYTGGGKVGSFYTKTTDNGKSFVGYDSISYVGRHPQLTSLSNGDLVIVWDETVQYSNKSNKRIGIQIRSAEGVRQQKEYLTPDDLFASYPVVIPVNNGAVVAYCRKNGDNDYVFYQQVSLESGEANN